MSIANAKQAQMSVGHTADSGRPIADFYQTCPQAVRGLLSKEKGLYKGTVWEPACGKGAISNVLREHQINVYSSDLYDRGCGDVGIDFLTAPIPSGQGIKHVVTNPPFSQSFEFAEKGAEVIRETSGLACFLNRLQWLEGIKRKEMFKRTGLSRVWVFSRRIPRMHRPGYTGKKSSSLIAFAWYVWDAWHVGETKIGWIDWKDAA